MPSYKLVSFKLCPYVQRSVITLEEKGVPYELEYIDLKHKPAWFLARSPLGKVPILILDDAVLFESAVINEYIDETAPGERMLPAEPLARAQQRAWVEVAAELLRKMWALTVAPDAGAARRAADEVQVLLSRFETVLGRLAGDAGKVGEGPLFGGERFSIVDAATAPGLQRLTWCAELAPSLGLFANLPRVTAWRDALLRRESVKRSTVPTIRELFESYIRGDGSAGGSGPAAWIAAGASGP